MNALTKVEPRPDEWTRDRVDTLKKAFCPTGISDSDFALFLEQCKRSGLDPFRGEIFCVPRNTNVGSKGSPQWVTRHVAQPAEAGMMARADRFDDFRGIKAAAIYSGDAIAVTQDGVEHSFNPAKREGQFVSAWAQTFREGRVYPVEIVKLEAYRQDTAMWRGNPDTMLVKCARAAALRRAYPNAFGGLYVREEMPEEDDSARGAVDGTKVARGLAGIPSKGEAPKASTSVVESPREKKPAALPAFVAMSMDTLVAKSREMEDWLGKYPKAKKESEGQLKLEALKAEIQRRKMETEPMASYLPHSDDDDAGPR